jgi:hypothetical protein
MRRTSDMTGGDLLEGWTGRSRGHGDLVIAPDDQLSLAIGRHERGRGVRGSTSRVAWRPAVNTS